MSATRAVDYPTLVSRIAPRVIRSEEVNKQYVALLEELDDRWESLQEAERELHELLVLLIEDYERRTYTLHAATPTETLAELMEANGLKQKDLVGVFETASIVSEVLSGKRELTKGHIKRLSERFHVSPEVFF